MAQADSTASDHACVVLFDGVCNLCSRSVQFIIRRDAKRRFRFAPLQSEAARQMLKLAAAPLDRFEGVVLIERGRAYCRSDAVLRIASKLRFPWPLAGALLLLPRRFRDGVYDGIARRRYRWFGKKEACMVPTPKWRDRFLDAGCGP
ncbi:MAG: DUF393 domain-containing protein [Phycisphaerales bacterium]|nr:DUF393 domain-containing protein [Phycisphaerales bacterium]